MSVVLRKRNQLGQAAYSAILFFIQWFQWVYHFKSLDRRLPGPGKQYRAYFYIPYIGYEKMNFRMVDFSAYSHFVLKSVHPLESKLEVYVTPQGTARSLLTISVTFENGTLLYQWTVGVYLRCLANKHIEDAMELLKSLGVE